MPFTVIGEIGAGYVANRGIDRGEAYRIMTGALLPENADAVVMLEQTVETRRVHPSQAVYFGENISFKGEDAKKGERLIEKGEFIHPGTIALSPRLATRMFKSPNDPLRAFYRLAQNYYVWMKNLFRKNSKFQRSDD